MHDDAQSTTFDEFLLAEFPRLVSVLTAWSGDRPVAEDLARDAIPTADDQLWERARALPATQRDATILRYVDDLPLADIAVVLGWSGGTVKTHLQRARQTLADHLTTGAETPR